VEGFGFCVYCGKPILLADQVYCASCGKALLSAKSTEFEPISSRDQQFDFQGPLAVPGSGVSRKVAVDRLTHALVAAKKARDEGQDVSEIRKTFQQARVALEAEDYDTAFRLADISLVELGSPAPPHVSSPIPPVGLSPPLEPRERRTNPVRWAVLVVIVVLFVAGIGATLLSSSSTPPSVKVDCRECAYSVDTWTEDVTVSGILVNVGGSNAKGVVVYITIHDRTPLSDSFGKPSEDLTYDREVFIGDLGPGQQRSYERTYDVPIWNPAYVVVEYSLDWA